jgi:tetratricopeptide (TPR) repeat protein
MPQRAGKDDEGDAADAILTAEIEPPHDEAPHDEAPHDEAPHDEAPHDGEPDRSLDDLLATTDQGWDVEAQVRTLQQVAATSRATDSSSNTDGPTARPRWRSKFPPPLPRKGPPPLPAGGTLSPAPSPVRIQNDLLDPESLFELLRSRIALLEGSDDALGLARAHVELAIATDTILGDRVGAIAHGKAALRAEPGSLAAHAFLRRATHGREALEEMLAHVEHELLGAATDAHRVELLVERGRLLEATGGRGAEARATWEQVLAHAPTHPSALKGLEAELVARSHATGATKDWEALAAHQGRMADAYTGDARLASWLHIERALVLERKLARVDASRAALERALELSPGVGPVRDALVRHVAAHGDWPSLASLLGDEALVDPDTARAARYELDAALVAVWRLGDPERARALLDRAAARSPTEPSVDRRVLDELVRLSEAGGHAPEAARARRARLRFMVQPAALAYELRVLAAAAEKEGDFETAVADVQQALALDPADSGLVVTLDRLLSAAGKHEQRVVAWLQEAARSSDPSERGRALVQAARICQETGRQADALRHFRSAWVVAPNDAEVVDGLALLGAPRLGEGGDSSARALVELYSQAAEQSSDPGRRVAYLEKVAFLWEDLLADPARAVRAYEQVLVIDAHRRSALVGLARAASRAGDGVTLSRALLEEARLATDEPVQLDLRARAATALAKHDPSRAAQIVREVLDRDPAHRTARALEIRLHEQAGRWELAAHATRARIDTAGSVREKVLLWLSLAQLQNTRLRAPLDAIVSLERARSLDPTHPVAREQAANVLENIADARKLRETIERLATSADTAEDRARYLARAAEIDELRLGDDPAAARAYPRALSETPDDKLLFERLARLTARRARQNHGNERAELAALIEKRIDRAEAPEDALHGSFDLAWLFVETGQEPRRAVELLESVLATDPDHVPALRTLEWLRRSTTIDSAALGRVLGLEAAAFTDPGARLGALWNLAFLEEWVVPGADPGETYKAILALDPSDPGALEATFRRELQNARRGEPRARSAVISAVRALLSFTSGDARLALELQLGLLLESAAADMPDSTEAARLLAEALDRYASALEIDPASITAATGLARLASRQGDAGAALAASESLSLLAGEPRTRARYLVDGAEILLGTADLRVAGAVSERRARAAAMLERALDADPESIPAAGRLATVLLEDGQGERLVSTFRTALGRAKAGEAIVMLGSEIARVARDDLHDLPAGIDALRRVRASAPQHVPSLLTLAELCIAQRVWPEAVDTLEAIVSMSRELAPKLTALFALASIYEKVLARPSDVDRVLRTALAVDPSNIRALRALVRRVAAEPEDPDAEAKTRRRREFADLLHRLAEVETDLEQRSGILAELSEVQLRLGETQAAEASLIAAVACSPTNIRAFTHLSGLFRGANGLDQAAYGRALVALVEKGAEHGHADARWFASLGHVEVEALGRVHEGIAHLRRAVELDPTLYEARFALASACARVGANDEASRVLLEMLIPMSHPLLSILDPAAALALLESSLSAERRVEESVVASELRAVAGDLESSQRDWLRLRRLSPLELQHGSIDRTSLVTHVLPSTGRHVLLEVAAAIAGVEAKILRSDLTEIGITARDRISSRSGHPTRLLLDRIARQLGAVDVELVITPRVTRTRVIVQDSPWIVLPSAVAQGDEPLQLVHLARAVARVALGVPWLEELAPANVKALLIAAARHVAPDYGRTSEDEALISHYEPAIGRALTRRQRRLLEELAPHLTSPEAQEPDVRDLTEAIRRAELRAAFLVGGDFLAIVDEQASNDDDLREAVEIPSTRALLTVLEHPLVGDVARFALSADATALRHRLGSIWTR